MSELEDKLKEKYAELLKVCFNVCEDVYRYLAVIPEDDYTKQLKTQIDGYIVDELFKDYLQHKYILKDQFQTEGNDIDMECEKEEEE